MPDIRSNTVIKKHDMNFGVEIRQEGGVDFRLWAPDLRQVVLCLDGEGDERLLEMESQAEGWHRYFDEKSGPGTRYSFQIDDTLQVPDPASRCQPEGVHQASMVTDPRDWPWQDDDWRGRPLEEAVFYELHVGTFSRKGDYAGVEEKLDYLADLGVTAIQLMPIAAFAGGRNWGYDGVLPYAPAACYGPPEMLKSLIQAAHRRGIMVFLDVVYNHFGPEGNYLHLYASSFFTERYRTPWGAAIRFSGEGSHWVRRFFIENALYWLEEFHFDGLRLDAVHAINDPSEITFLDELAEAVNNGPGRERHIHLILENYDNEAKLLARDRNGKPRHYSAQWNDDIHHAMHILLTGESDGYYMDYADNPLAHLGRCLTEGFAYQGEISAWRQGKRRGSPSVGLPPAAFVNFLQNHDQIGNRAFGERLSVLVDKEPLRVMSAILLLAPQPPLLFMGQEWSCEQPFLYFCDFGDDLAPKVRDGRRQEFAGFAAFRDKRKLQKIPDPCAVETFEECRLDWSRSDEEKYRQWLALHRKLLLIRKNHIMPRLGRAAITGSFTEPAPRGIVVEWQLADASRLNLYANFSDRRISIVIPEAEPLYLSKNIKSSRGGLELGSWSAAVYLQPGEKK